MSTANRIIKNTGFLYAKMGITMFISLYTTRLILNSLGAEDFGIFNIVGGAIAMLGFLNGAMASATQRFMSYSEGEGNKEKQKQIFNISVVLHFLIALAAGVLLVIAGYFFFNGILNIPADRIFAAKVVYASLIVSTMFTVMTVPYDAVMNAHENMKYYAIVGIIESVLKLAVALIVVYTLSDKLIVYGILMAGIPLITMTIMRKYCHKHYEECVFGPRAHWHKGLMKEMGAFAGWNLINSASGITSNYGLSIVLNNFWGALLNAAQGISNQISGQLMVFSNTMLKALNPVITKSEGSGNRELMLRTSMAGAKYSYIMFGLFAIPFMIETPYLLKIWLKNVPDWTILFCRLQLLRSLVEQLTITIGSSLSAQGDIKTYSILKSVVGFLPIILTILLFHFQLPPYYMYVVWIFCGGILGGGIALYFFKKKCGVKYSAFTKEVLLPCLVLTTIICSVGVLPTLFIQEGASRLILVNTLTLCFSVLTLWFYILTPLDKGILKNILYVTRNKIRRK